MNTYPKAEKYPDLDTVYEQCSGPGGLKLAEFVADKLDLQPSTLLLDIGFNRGYQTCFLSKEYGTFVVGIDPWEDLTDGCPHVEHLMRNARSWGVEDRVLGIRVGVPDTRFADASFDAVYCTTTLEMIRGFKGEDRYRQCLSEILRVLRPGGLFGLAEPMHLEVDVPEDLAPLVSKGPASFVDCFVTVKDTVAACRAVGFEIVEADYAPDANAWWKEYRILDPRCKNDPEETRMLDVDRGRWISFGYVIAQRPL